jgi:hypothetical protein
VIAVLLLVGGITAQADGLAASVAAARGAALPVAPTIDAMAQASAQRQANAGAISHGSLAGVPCEAAGEIVGMGPSIPVIWEAFRASPSHWDLIMRPGWTSIGTGVATGSNGSLYVAVIFCRSASQQAPPAPAPAPAPPKNASPQPAPASPAPTEKAPEALPPTYQEWLRHMNSEVTQVIVAFDDHVFLVYLSTPVVV